MRPARPDRSLPARGPRRPAGGRGTAAGRRSGDDATVLYGWHPVLEALRNPGRGLRRLLATENAAHRLVDELGSLPIDPMLVPIDEISRRLEPDAVHQGLYLEADPLEGPDLADLPPDAFVIALDQVTDPHNVGAVVRSAAAFGAAAILTTARHSPSATGVLAKAASGGLEHVPFVVVRNLADALITLGEQGYTRIGLDSEGDVGLAELQPARPLVLVLGAEGRGLRQRTRACCDAIARLDMPGAIKSLNVSNAAAIAMFALTAPRSAPKPTG